MKLKLPDLFTLIREAALAFGQDKAPRLAAAVAYYSIFAVAPLLFFVLAVASGLLANVDVQERLFSFLAENINESAVEFVQGILPSGNQLQQSSVIASIIGFVTLFLGATGLFVQVQDALNTLWGAEPGPAGGVWNIVKSRLQAFVLILAFGVLVIAFLVGNTYLSSIAGELGNAIGLGAFFVRVVTLLVSVGVLTLVFAGVFKVLPNVKLQWREVWVGSAVTAVLFGLGQLAISWYLGRFAPGSAFGAAGALVILLLWIYYSAMIFFFGAEVTWVYSQKYGSGAGGAVSVTKKEELINKGADLDPTPSDQELEGLKQAAEQGKPIPGRWARLVHGVQERRAELPRVLPEVPTREEGRVLPTVRGTLWNAVTALLAVPTVIVLRVLGLTGGQKK
ncbi:YihY/virulence factor BrkB family protein [Deinococcus sp. SDU3-2]|uniref:YihY/virulence factor BrkB family protein n=1 Tax=Deinococcus terrestris TaxID=2651870 RepID=A0A7X1NXI5_9DEIO|nr:YihY/virulence factor BrkB family protein [Deinococcus terrestris]MPY67518.1 YihY/virulence factor BrkB family protein [Deinococcus terrestris]